MSFLDLREGSRWVRKNGMVEVVDTVRHVYSANVGTQEEPIVMLVYETPEGEARLARSDEFACTRRAVDDDRLTRPPARV